MSNSLASSRRVHRAASVMPSSTMRNAVLVRSRVIAGEVPASFSREKTALSSSSATSVLISRSWSRRRSLANGRSRRRVKASIVPIDTSDQWCSMWGEDRPCSFLKFLAAHPGAVQQHLAYILQGGTAALSG